MKISEFFSNNFLQMWIHILVRALLPDIEKAIKIIHKKISLGN